MSAEELDENESELKQLVETRIKVSIINFDWIFEDENCRHFLFLLVSHAKFAVFKQKSVKTFVDFLWQYY